MNVPNPSNNNKTESKITNFIHENKNYTLKHSLNSDNLILNIYSIDNKDIYESKYSYDEIINLNRYFIICETLKDMYDEICSLIENKKFNINILNKEIKLKFYLPSPKWREIDFIIEYKSKLYNNNIEDLNKRIDNQDKIIREQNIRLCNLQFCLLNNIDLIKAYEDKIKILEYKILKKIENNLIKINNNKNFKKVTNNKYINIEVNNNSCNDENSYNSEINNINNKKIKANTKENINKIKINKNEKENNIVEDNDNNKVINNDENNRIYENINYINDKYIFIKKGDPNNELDDNSSEENTNFNKEDISFIYNKNKKDNEDYYTVDDSNSVNYNNIEYFNMDYQSIGNNNFEFSNINESSYINFKESFNYINQEEYNLNDNSKDKDNINTINFEEDKNEEFDEETIMINKFKRLIGRNCKLDLIYQMTRDGNTTIDFHRKVDIKGPTITLFKTKDGSFGGYTSKSFKSNGGWIKDRESFLFNFDNLNKFKIKNNSENAVFYGDASKYGPEFYDILVNSGEIQNGTIYPSNYINKVEDLKKGNADFISKDVLVYRVNII